MRRALLFAGLWWVWLALPAQAALLWRFDATLADDLRTLEVSACSAGAVSEAVFSVAAAGAEALLSARRSSARPLVRDAQRLVAADWRQGECLHTRIDLSLLARQDRYRLGGREDRFWRSAPRLWLWRPARIDADSTIGFRLPKGWSVSVPWRPLPDGRHRLGATPADWPASVVIGRFEEVRLPRPGGVLRVSVVPTADAVPVAALTEWIGQVADDLLHSHARMPLPDVQVLVVPLPSVRSAVPWGQVTRGGGSAIHLFPGLEAGPSAWRNDWTATHEFAHLLHPFLGDRGRWLGEGLASYYQNVLRARSGQLSQTQAWDKLIAGFERGRAATPEDADSLSSVAVQRRRGSTMRVYWAGAAFWLERDLDLRRAGSSLDEALARFAAQHLPAERRWHPEDFVAELDRLTPAGRWVESYHRFAGSRQFPALPPALARWSDGAQPSAEMSAVMQATKQFSQR